MKYCSFRCPSCRNAFALHAGTYVARLMDFDSFHGGFPRPLSGQPDPPMVDVRFYRCPSCGFTSIRLTLTDYDKTATDLPVYPSSDAIVFPHYVPEQIRMDYEEAHKIVTLSPRASSTLSRRCLQGMLRDFWKVSGKSLFEELNAVKDKVQPTQWKAIDAIRKIGNIGAHMEEDVNIIVDVKPEEAEMLLKLIELLIEKWYIGRHDEQELYQSVSSLGEQKTQERRGGIT